MKNTKKLWSLKNMTLLALFVALELVMKMLGLGMVPVGPLKMSFLTIPVAVGAMLLGPLQGMILGGVFGLISLWDAVSGASAMTGWFFSFSPFHTVMLCVVMRMLMGLATGLIYRAVRGIDRTRIVAYFAGALAAPLLNTLLFMGYIVLVFYNTEYVQMLVQKLGAANPIAFVALLVGVQGLVEAGVCMLVGGSVAKGVSKAVKL